MPTPRAVVFDLGKVLLDFDYARVARNMRRYCGLSEEDLVRLLNQSQLLHRYETGLLTSEAFFQEVKRASKFCHGFEQFEPLFADIFTPVDEMIQLHDLLRSRNIPTYIFSNTNEIAVRHIRRAYPFFNRFTDYIFSFEHRSMKPDPRIYEVVEEKSSLRGPDLLYIDDRAENVAHGRERGWQTIHHSAPEPTIKKVRELGLI
jgi:putative hydrolase of the HAD superfamily